MTRWARGVCFVVAVFFFAGCYSTVGLPPASSVARFVRTSWEPDAKPRGKVAATAAGDVFLPEGRPALLLFAPEAAVRLDLGSRYELAPTVSTGLLSVDGQLVLLRNGRGSLGVLHGVGFGASLLPISFSFNGGTSSIDYLYATFHAGLLGQLRAGPGTAYTSSRYAYATGANLGRGTGVAVFDFSPAHYLMQNVGYLLRLGGSVSVSFELGVGAGRQLRATSGLATANWTLLLVPSVTVAADF